jgi:hypothetical protein
VDEECRVNTAFVRNKAESLVGEKELLLLGIDSADRSYKLASISPADEHVTA